MENNNFFIIGVRRSGTSILRKLIIKSVSVKDILFEPHPLWFAAMMQHFDRFNGKDFYKKTLEKFKDRRNGKLYGAKFALNPGIDALDWVWLDEVFDKPRFIFVTRKLMDSFRSYENVDKNIHRGAISEEAYIPAFAFVIRTFKKFANEHSNRSLIIRYEDIVKNADHALAPAWKLLEARPVKGLNKHIEKPLHWSGK